MPDSLPAGPSGAVFLSYASQDAEAAKRICEALREAGIEVWFDQSELRGGDAWDQSIRRQIKECALFMPIISVHAQARREGYFRLEWRLADDRTHLMAMGTPFILPVSVDDTSRSDAIVPDSFKVVQWTRLAGGETPAAFCKRVKELLSGEATEPGHQNRATAGPTSAPRPGKKAGLRLVLGIIGVIACAALVTWQPWRKGEQPAAAVSSAAPASEAQQLVARAWEQLNKTELGPEELEIADGLCKRAAEIAPDDSDIWAAWSQVDSWYVYHNFDSSKARQDAARSNAARALKLAPASFEARLAQACFLVRGGAVGTGNGGVSTFAPEAEQLLRRLLQEKADEPRALFASAILERNLGHQDEARAEFARLARNPRFSATALNELAWAEYFNDCYSAVDAPLQRSLAIQKYYGNLGLNILISLRWHGDLAAAKAAVEQLPASVMQTDYGASIAFPAFYWQRTPDGWLKFAQEFRHDWTQSNGLTGPVAYWNGLAQQMAGRNDAARLEWEAALRLIEQRLADQPTAIFLLWFKGELLARLGRLDEAEKFVQLAAELGRGQDWTVLMHLKVAEGRIDEAMDMLGKKISPGMTAADLRLDPDYDPLRANPRFKALLAHFEADPRRSPNAPKKAAVKQAPTGTEN